MINWPTMQDMSELINKTKTKSRGLNITDKVDLEVLKKIRTSTNDDG